MRGRRMAAELKKLRDGPVGGVTVVPSESDVGTWTVFVEGPTESVYSGSLFELVVKFPDQYPIAAPTVTFLTPIFHPNVSDKGELCNGLLLASTAPPASGAGAAGRAGVLPTADDGLGKWSAAVVMADVFRALQKLLLCPVPEHPMNTTAADLFQSNHPEFIRMAAALRGASACAGAGSGSG